MFFNILFLIIGFILLIGGSRLLIYNSSNIAKRMHISEFIIGLTIVSVGTSLPELFIGIESALESHHDIIIGNIIGSNICNILLILGLAALIKPIKFDKYTKLYEIPMCIFFTSLVFIFGLTGNTINRIESFILLMCFVLFIVYTIHIVKQEKSNSPIVKNKESIIKLVIDLLLIIISIVFLKIGGDMVVNNTVKIANYLMVSEEIISLTLIALGTSLPELVTTITSLIKGKSSIAIGNIIGSVIINTLLIIGVSSIINPLIYNIDFNLDFIISILSIILLLLYSYIKPKDNMTRNNGIISILLFIAYVIIIFVWYNININ